MKADELKQQWKDAAEYVAKYGAPEPHLHTTGKLHKVDVDTEICHQESPSAQNYWKDTNFDCALDEVIRSNFPALADKALAIMQKKFEDALLEEKTALLARLAEIQAIEEQA
ncbi:hypothetical protein OKW43_000029 [Paraburkholderia sp. WC7.3g]|uniref:hypothetical protein n=1 Tax=Paraburkholderia sp. WC7.3g TaxID=2991070 RepID=UPI003D214B50